MATSICRYMEGAVRGANSERRARGPDEGGNVAPGTRAGGAAVVDGGVWKHTCSAGIWEGPPRLQLFARVPAGRTIVISAEGTSTVDAVKDQVSGRTLIPAADQRLVFAGRDLQNGRALQDYGITDNSTIHVLLRLRGGSGPAQTGITGVSQDLASVAIIGTDESAPSGAPNRCMQDWIERAVLKHFDIVQASTSVEFVNLSPKGDLSRLDSLGGALKGLAFDPLVDNPWAILGLAPMESVALDELLVQQRGEIADMLFLAMTQNGWTAREVSVAQQWREKIQNAAVQCQEELPVMLRRRESNKGGAVPRWAELGKEALSMLLSHPLGVGEEIATQLSQVLAAHQGEADCVLQVQRARELQKALLSGGPDALQQSGVSNAILWCPT